MQRLSERLLCAARFVRNNSIVWDVGTDHCHIPIFLLENNIAKSCIASDVNLGPLEKAEKNLSEYPQIKEKITLLCENGIVSAEKYRPDDIVICGMGGELIRDIVLACPYTRNENVRLILQPMTKSEILRSSLYSSGYEILDERLVRDDKIYEVIYAGYCGEKREISPLYALLGEKNIERGGELFLEFLGLKMKHLKARIDGKKSAGLDFSDESGLYYEMERLKEKK